MQKMTQGWFTKTTDTDDLHKPSPSLLADWNSYASSQQAQETSDLDLGFDLEAAVRSANDTVTGTFGR